jgi:hypothetical protein
MDVSMTWVPVDACTLPTADQPLRVAEFDALFAASLRSVERAPAPATRVRLVLTGDEDLRDRVELLVEAETACCSFFTFRITRLGDDVLAVDVEVPGGQSDVLAGLVDRAERVRGASA